MTKSCCVKPFAKIIKVRDFGVGIVGLEIAMQSVYRLGIKDEEQTQSELLRFVKEFGNYITPDIEADYKEALWREYRMFASKMAQESKHVDIPQ